MKKRHQLFIASYAEHHSAEKAAIAAGYSPRSAATQGYRLLANVEISDAIDKKIEKKVAALEMDSTVLEESRSALRAVVPESVEILVKMLRDPLLDPSTRLQVLKEVQDRAGLIKQVENTGPQTIVVTGGLPLDPTK